jgi:hypothetical protein
MKTPLQELINIVKERNENVNSMPFMWNGDIIKIAESLLDKEKEIMCQFQSDGQQTDFYVKYENSEDCFDKTFTTNEK